MDGPPMGVLGINERNTPVSGQLGAPPTPGASIGIWLSLGNKFAACISKFRLCLRRHP